MSGGKDWNAETSSVTKGRIPNWNVMAVRAKVTDQCFWSACKAMTAGVVLIVVGAGMATLGFYSDHLSRVEESKGNTSVWVKNESKDSHLGSLTYLGPVVMGIGGFIIVAACVMTFEARDTAAKIVPIWLKRIHVLSGSTPSCRSSKTSWERQKSTQEQTRTALTQALLNFSQYLQNSVDTNKIALNNKQTYGLRKCPSEPSLAKIQRDALGNNLPEGMLSLEVSTPQPSQRTAYGLQPITGTCKPQLLSVAPDTYRQAVSMDYPRSARLQEEEKPMQTNAPLQTSEKCAIQMLPLQTSCATSSSGSMSVDIYLPQGSVTLKVHDDMKNSKKSPLKQTFSNDSRCTKFSQQSDIHSFVDDEEYLSGDFDDSVFVNQELNNTTPQIVLETSDSKETFQISPFDKVSPPTNNTYNPAIELWASKCHSTFSHTESASESLEVQTPGTSSVYSSFSTNFSFDSSDKISQSYAMDSVLSNTFSSKLPSQISPTQTDLMNVSSSMDSSQDVSSPLIFCTTPAFDFSQESAENKDLGSSHMEHKNENLQRKALSESTPKHVSIVLDPVQFERLHQKSSPRKHSSLDSAQMQSLKSRMAAKLQHSLESSHIQEDAPPQRFLCPTSPTAPSTAQLTFSPRKSRSESLPERRQAPSLKRFPLLRQGALDSLGEEGASTHRLDRSQSHKQI